MSDEKTRPQEPQPKETTPSRPAPEKSREFSEKSEGLSVTQTLPDLSSPPKKPEPKPPSA